MPKVRKHLLPSPNLEFPKTLHEDKHKLAKADIPVVTISASFKKDISKTTGEKDYIAQEVVYSRAHYSMAVAILAEAKRRRKTYWFVDPINYVSKDDWEKIRLVERVGQLTARIKILKRLKDLVDSFARSKMPISSAVREPLLYVTRLTKKPIISLHYETGNILAENGRHVLQVVTDPQVHEAYLFQAERKNITFAVFDEETKQEFFTKALKRGLYVDQERVVVTGPPVDPRITKAREKKKAYSGRGPLRLVITTSGLGTNKDEISKILDSLLPKLEDLNIELILHAGTHKDFEEMFVSLALKHGIACGSIESQSVVRINYSEGIVLSNQNLIDYAFPWAHGFITKPSGDMAYDAVGSGCFLLTLDPWGEWEENIQKIFEKQAISKKADTKLFDRQIRHLKENGWLSAAQNKALKIDLLFLEGAKKIVDLAVKLNYNE